MSIDEINDLVLEGASIDDQIAALQIRRKEICRVIDTTFPLYNNIIVPTPEGTLRRQSSHEFFFDIRGLAELKRAYGPEAHSLVIPTTYIPTIEFRERLSCVPDEKAQELRKYLCVKQHLHHEFYRNTEPAMQ